jgi:metal-responsive CopG/Arc/MetJ family transcriptional regulator
MRETTVYLSEEIAIALEQLAHQMERSQADLIREAIENYLSQSDRPLPHSVGMGASGRSDLSERDEELLWQ